MSYKRLFIIGFICSLIFACGGSGESDAPTANLPEPSVQSIQTILDKAVADGLLGALVYVDADSQSSNSYSAGIRNPNGAVPATPDDLFKVASISKLFIAAAASKMISDGLIQQDQTLSFWLPELSDDIENADSITLAMLLQHRSGVPDFDSAPGFSWENAHTDIDLTLSLILGRSADFAPDQQYEYSNSNYLLVGKILDKALTYSHREYIRDRILIPLELYDTYSLLQDADDSRMMHGYWNATDRLTQDYVIPGGSMVSSAKDIGLFTRALNTGLLFTAEEQAIYDELYWRRHSGWLPGYQSITRYYQDIDSVVVLFVNETGDNTEDLTEATYNSIVSLLRN